MPVGYLLSEGGRWYALFNQQAAFALAQREYPGLIPHGQTAHSTWESAWSERIASGPWRRKGRSGGRPLAQVRARGLEGVPVPLSTLLDLDG
ncbi:hypothetical protein [Intrasporangium sp.]|uniref:hypothetical protein n=1 Tax=Intrasporangium sp. TaxID=1925024 RepID=UPI003221A0BB